MQGSADVIAGAPVPIRNTSYQGTSTSSSTTSGSTSSKRLARRVVGRVGPPSGAIFLLSPDHPRPSFQLALRRGINGKKNKIFPWQLLQLRSSEHGPDVGEERIVIVCVSTDTVEVRRGSVKFVPVRILQADAEVQPWPE